MLVGRQEAKEAQQVRNRGLSVVEETDDVWLHVHRLACKRSASARVVGHGLGDCLACIASSMA